MDRKTELIFKLTVALLMLIMCLNVAAFAQEAPQEKPNRIVLPQNPPQDDKQSDEQADSRQMRILFIGNSFTNYNNLNKIFGSIADSFGINVKAERLSSDGYFLNQFASENDSYGRVLERRLQTYDDFDIFVLQEYSTHAYTDFDDFYYSASLICEKIRNTQKNARIYLYETWGYESAAKERGWTPPEMEMRISIAYNIAANKLGTKVCPVGKAFSKAFHENNGAIFLYAADKKHPSYAGSYLAACVNAAAILNVDVRQTDFYGELDEETAKILQKIAYEVVEEGRKVQEAKNHVRKALGLPVIEDLSAEEIAEFLKNIPEKIPPKPPLDENKENTGAKSEGLPVQAQDKEGLIIKWLNEKEIIPKDGMVYIAEGSDDARAMVITSDSAMKELKVLKLEFDNIDETGKVVFRVNEASDMGDADSEQSVYLKIELIGMMPNYGISWIDDDGNEHYYSINESGKDGSLFLDEISIMK